MGEGVSRHRLPLCKPVATLAAKISRKMYSDKEWRVAVGKTSNKTGDGNRVGRWSDGKKMKRLELLYLA
jgi:hypothetical protein